MPVSLFCSNDQLGTVKWFTHKRVNKGDNYTYVILTCNCKDKFEKWMINVDTISSLDNEQKKTLHNLLPRENHALAGQYSLCKKRPLECQDPLVCLNTTIERVKEHYNPKEEGESSTAASPNPNRVTKKKPKRPKKTKLEKALGM